MIVEGQVHGGIAQGVGQALLEGAVYDSDGQLVTGSFMDYCMPRADDLPVLQGRLDGDQLPIQPARHQGLRRGRRDRGAGRGDQRDHRRDRRRGHCRCRRRPQVVWAALQKPADCAQGGGVRRRRCTHSPITVPTTVRQAARLLAKTEDAKLLAGGQTLIPTMKQRLAKPDPHHRSVARRGTAGIELKGRSIVIGAMTRHAEVANSPIVQEAIPALAAVAGVIGDPQVRNVGTIGGSIANNDPTADYPAACLGLGATIVTNKRRIAADEFFTGMFETALEPDEIITKVQFPIAQKAAYQKFRNPASRFALVGVFVSKRGAEVRVAVTGAGAERRVPRARASRRRSRSGSPRSRWRA